MSGKIRDTQMDALKGLAILLVVLGHSLSELPNFDQNILFRVIYSFHMPLFMFISGYVAFYGRDNTSWVQIRKKALVLALPFAAWYGLSYFLNGAYHTTGVRHYIKLVLLSPDRGLWFLWVLFVNFVVLALALRFERKLGIWAIPLAWVLLQLVPVDILGLSLVRWHFAFFAIGFLVHRYKSTWYQYRNHLAAVGLAAFPILVSFWHRTSGPDFAGPLERALDPLHLPVLSAFLLGLYAYLVPMLGIAAAWALVTLSSRFVGWAYQGMGWLGLYTLDIYVTHQYLVRFGVGEGWLKTVSGFIVALVGSLLISLIILRPNRLLAMILLGRSSTNRAADGIGTGSKSSYSGAIP